jgi:tetratricopeptide (TPR) repeat protein
MPSLYEAGKRHAIAYMVNLALAGFEHRHDRRIAAKATHYFARPELPNLRLAIEWSIIHSQTDAGAARLCVHFLMVMDLPELLEDPTFHIQWMMNASVAAFKLQEPKNALIAIGVLAEDFCRIGEFEKAEDVLNDALRIAEEMGLQQERQYGGYLNLLGTIYLQRGNPEDSLRILKSAAEIVTGLPEECSVFLNMGNAFHALGQNSLSLEHYTRSLQLAKTIGNDKLVADALGSLANIHEVLGERELATGYRSEALALQRSIADVEGEATTLLNFPAEFDYTEVGFAGDVDSIAGKSISPEVKCGLLIKKGAQSSHAGNHASALQYFEDALTLSRKIGSQITTAEVLENIGLVNAMMGKYESAITFYNEAYGIFGRANAKGRQAHNLTNQANAHFALRDVAKAIALHESAILLSLESGERKWEATARMDLALLLHRMDRRKEAIRHALMALNIFTTVDSTAAAVVRRTLDSWQGVT